MKIAIDLNGVVRDVFSKSAQVYEKFYLDELSESSSSHYNEETKEWVKEDENEDSFNYELDLPVTSLNLIDHFKFDKSEDI